MRARVVHVNDHVPGAVYIGRASPRRGLRRSRWANPFGVREVGLDRAIVAYRDLLVRSPDLRHALPGLRGEPLACWCRHDGEDATPGTRCHGDVLVALLDAFTDDDLLSITWGVGHVRPATGAELADRSVLALTGMTR